MIAAPHAHARWRVSGEEPTDATLVAATLRGDSAAFGVLVRRHIRAATLLAAQLLGDWDDAKDVVQDAFSAVYRNAGTYDPNRPFPPWLFAIVRRLAANRRARERRRARLLNLSLWGNSSEPTVPSVENALFARLDAAAARRAVDELSPMQRACFELVALRDLSTAEVAAMHGISESTVRQHVFRARALLRGILDRND